MVSDTFFQAICILRFYWQQRAVEAEEKLTYSTVQYLLKEKKHRK